ncbi:MAG: M23 family metallopeptidase [Spirochaetales bacterium]|uniref:M23 family metallopeptidase n=1 Tax=Candidatus Thalassospirochaeta sargassi TaxID=3119039 RepID=A0AAJ1MMH6_9SPIO|nr:M23 family metallopeptidase [Spirochaetales bacterium]
MNKTHGTDIRTAILLLFLTLSLVFTSYVFSESSSLYPEINRLDYSDLNYRQLQEDIEFYHKASGSGKTLPPLMFYSYRISDSTNIFSLAAEAGLTYDTISSLNRIGSSLEDLSGRVLLLPSQPGVFLPLNPNSDLEYIALSWRASQLEKAQKLNIRGEEYYFYPGEAFHDVERAYFLRILFMNPLPKGIVTSGYGMRESPFTGHQTFHNGIDIAAPLGTPVYAARDGVVIAAGNNNTYGNYLEIAHAGGYSTFYGHLNKFFVELQDQVNSTMIIAEVGSSGLSTGPHLHFEVKRNGKSRNPASLTPGLE